MIARKCTRCGFEGESEQFVRDSNAKFGRRNRCIRCDNKRQGKVQKNYRDRKRKFIDSFKNKPCADCGVKYPPYVMDFDHLGNKEFSLYEAIGHNFSEEKILAEINKCEVVCANCHRIRTQQRNEKKYAIKEM